MLGLARSLPTATGALVIVALGGAIVKPVISGTAARSSDAAHRARAFSIFYTMINIGSFTGKTVAPPLRTGFVMPGVGELKLGLEYINFYAACMALIALLVVTFLYRDTNASTPARSFRTVVRDFARVVCNGRFMCLIVIVAGFWIIQGQLYASLTKYILRMVGESAKPEWMANINPLVVVCLVAFITQLVRNFKPVNSIAIAMLITPLAMLCFSLGGALQSKTGHAVSVLGLMTLHPITLMAVIGIGMIGLAECFLSPKFMEFASKQAPEGQVAQYMGFQNLSSAIAWPIGFIVSGFLLQSYCPDPTTLSGTMRAQWEAAIAGNGSMPAAYAHAHYIWYAFCAIGLAAFLGLLVFKYLTDRIDRRPAVEPDELGALPGAAGTKSQQAEKSRSQKPRRETGKRRRSIK
jgi:dipeptide/tripeptide permease